MQRLSAPAAAAIDDGAITRLAKKAEWAPHKDAWLQTYSQYRQHTGSPHQITAHHFGPGVKDRQIDLFRTRGRSGAIRRLRLQEGLNSCPICGSSDTGTLEHYLPKTAYPEFSIMLLNLVPACSHCNTTKNDVVPDAPLRRFIHPYFDAWAANPVWQIRIERPFAAATFTPVPIVGLTAEQEEIVRFPSQ